MKRSIAIISLVIAAVVIIPLVAQTSRSGNAEKVCPMGQGQVQASMAQCEAGQKCAECPKKASGECQGCQKQCEEGQICEACPKAGECQKACDMPEAGVCESAEGGCGMMGQGMGQGMMGQGCGMMGQCSQN